MILNFVLSVNLKRGGKNSSQKGGLLMSKKGKIFTNAKMDAGKTVTLRPAPKEMG